MDLILSMEASSPAWFRHWLISKETKFLNKSVAPSTDLPGDQVYDRSVNVHKWLREGKFWQRLWSFVFWTADNDESAKVSLGDDTVLHTTFGN